MDPYKIGRFICELRKEKNLSQYQLADMIPISRQGVSKWERGVTTPDPQTLLKLSEIFGVTINELLNGERLPKNTLEETTLTIIDENIKKTQKIKRISIISITIIVALLLAFLSYYFINSYNSIEVYKTQSNNDKFVTLDGIFIITKEKYYLKLGKIKNKIDAKINSIKLYYKIGNKKNILIDDTNIDDITIMDSYGYGEKLTRTNINDLKNNLYIEVTYNENQKTTMKLRCKRDYKNSSLFFLNQKTVKKEKLKENVKEELVITEEKKEEVKEETKPTIKEEIKPVKAEVKKTKTPTEEDKKTETQKEEKPKEEDKKAETPKEEEKKQEEPPIEEPTSEPEITTDMVINKIKETCPNTNGTYTCEYSESSIRVMYYSIMNRIAIRKDNAMIGQYTTNTNNYMCFVDNCESIFNEIFKEYLFQ